MLAEMIAGKTECNGGAGKDGTALVTGPYRLIGNCLPVTQNRWGLFFPFCFCSAGILFAAGLSICRAADIKGGDGVTVPDLAIEPDIDPQKDRQGDGAHKTAAEHALPAGEIRDREDERQQIKGYKDHNADERCDLFRIFLFHDGTPLVFGMFALLLSISNRAVGTADSVYKNNSHSAVCQMNLPPRIAIAQKISYTEV